jgi:hypothetical protein
MTSFKKLRNNKPTPVSTKEAWRRNKLRSIRRRGSKENSSGGVSHWVRALWCSHMFTTRSSQNRGQCLQSPFPRSHEWRMTTGCTISNLQLNTIAFCFSLECWTEASGLSLPPPPGSREAQLLISQISDERREWINIPINTHLVRNRVIFLVYGWELPAETLLTMLRV